jgi:hypothetical protein
VVGLAIPDAVPLACDCLVRTDATHRCTRATAALPTGNLNADGVSDLTEGAVYSMNVAALGKEAVSITGGTRRLGFYGVTPIAKPTATTSPATDAAITLSLVNDLRSRLVTLGLIS